MAEAFPVDDARLMTLAGIAYGASGKIDTYLAKATALGGEWTLVWTPGPGADPDNFAFLALNTKQSVAVLAIRGTYPNPLSPIYWENGQQDSPFGTMVEWPDTTSASSSARIAKGTNTGYQNLIGLKDAEGRSIAEFVGTLDPAVRICVTGHSLGGTLTPVMALKLSETEPDRDIYSVSFAGMTPGNSAFAALLEGQSPLSGRTRRVFNSLDSVAYGWNRVLATRDFFKPAPQGGILVKLFLWLAWFRLWIGRYDFAAIGEAISYEGAVDQPDRKHGLISYVIENLHQHMPDTYLKLMGAPPLPFSILFGSITLDKTQVTDEAPSHAALPVFHG